MIKEIDINVRENAKNVLSIQIPSYTVEANLIGSEDIPPLKDTVETLQNCGETFLGYFLHGELCGTIAFKLGDSEVDIHRLIVHPNYFRQGIAQELLNFIESNFHPETIKVATGTKNFPAVRFYKKNNFRIVKEVIVNKQLSLTYFEKRI
ncbi:N-acetyltransferase [Oceanobacillus piezotolerans]|uniref:N-acetyltransferase n=1 Tax=Oceanobacillus piezotolerans TaxID=2448030 RepID=A0A498DC00_9BACI|nr:GNAT family N-acetyltransferase [Oceanobacillus piezotolerans]RLL43641.1 N-acetyltransferase [Oceanobacillus piezotolerans]